MARKCLASYLVLAMFLAVSLPPAEAFFSPSQPPAAWRCDRERDIEVIRAALERKMVTNHLQYLGFSPAEIRSRLIELSDQQIHRLANQLEQIKVGGSGEGVLIGVLVIVLVIVVILPLIGIRVWR